MQCCKLLLIAVLLQAIFLTSVLARRGRGKSRMKNLRVCMAHSNSDANSRMEFYNNALGARIVKSSHFDYEYILGHKVVFLCEARGDPRPQITWFKDGVELYAHPFLQLHEWKISDTHIKSKMEIDPATQMDAGVYECYANNQYSVDCRMFKADFSIGD